MIKLILNILSNLSQPFASWWSKKQRDDEYKEELDYIADRDEWRRKADELREKYENAPIGTMEREKYFEDYLNHLDSPIN